MTDQRTPDQYPPIDGRDAEAAVRGDILTVGNITGSHVAIGRGASVIVHEAQSRIREVRLEEQHLSELIAGAIARRLNQYEQLTHKATVAPTANPYRALQSFDVEDAPLFFGRGADIEALLELLANPITILRSASGAGKSSLLKAGIASRLLAAGHLPIYVRPFRNSPTDAVKAWFLHGVDDHPELERARRESATAFLQRILDLLVDPGRLVVILVDQFEEFFYYLPEIDQRRFIDELERCSTQLSRRVRWVFAIRDDRFAELGAFCPPICLSFSQTYHLTWTAAQARETIIEPARLAGLTVDESLPPQIIDDLTAGERQLTPLHLQLICHTLYEASAGTRLSADSYHTLGAAQGILQSWLQRVLDGLPKENERAAARFVLRELVDSQFHRIRRERDELAAACAREPALSRVDLGDVLGYLEANGLARREGDGNAAEYELTHDFLAERIELDPETKSRKLAQEMLNFDLLVYRGNMAERPILISEDRLLLIENNLSTEIMSEEEQTLIRLSREQADWASKRNLRKTRALLGTVIFILLVVIGGLVAWIGDLQNTRNNRQVAAAATLVPVPSLGVSFEAHEVTNERYWACVDEGACAMPEGFREVRAAWETSRLLPAVNVEMAEAFQFCEWIGRSLPTYTEWTTVAPLEVWKTFGSDQALLCRDGETCEEATLRPIPVSARPQFIPDGEVNGIYDLVGSAQEWTRTTISNRVPVDVEALSELSGGPRAIVVLGDHYRQSMPYVGEYPQLPLDSTDSPAGSILRGFRCVEKLDLDVGSQSTRRNTMSELSSLTISVDRFEALVGAPIPRDTQDVESYVQDAFTTLSGQFTNGSPGDGLNVNIRTLAERYTLPMPTMPDDVIPFITQISSQFVRDQWSTLFPGQPTFDPTITEFDPDVGYGVNGTGGTLPPGLNAPFNPRDLPSTNPMPIVPPKGTHVTGVQICSSGKSISAIRISNGFFVVDTAPSGNQQDQSAQFPLVNGGTCYNYTGSCTAVEAWGTAAGENWTYRIEVATKKTTAN